MTVKNARASHPNISAPSEERIKTIVGEWWCGGSNLRVIQNEAALENAFEFEVIQ